MKVAYAYIPAALMIAVLSSGCQMTREQNGPWSAKQRATMRAEGFVPSERGWELAVSDRLLFPTNESRADPDQIAAITRIATNLKAVRIQHATIEGHADSSGTPSFNQALSQSRAETVAAIFISVGYLPANIRKVGLGSQYPVEDNGSAAGRRENRRVVVLLTAP